MQRVDSTHNPAAARGVHYGLIIWGQVILVTFSALGLGRFGYTSILPAMQEALHLTHTQTGILQSCNLLGYLVTAVIAGALAARHGPRLIIGVSLLVVAVGMFLTGLVPTFPAACLGRFLAGVGGAGSNVPAMGLISAWFAPRRRGLAAGGGVAGSSLGLMVTGPLVPAVIESVGVEGWRVSWYVLAGLTGAVWMVVALGLRNHPSEKGLDPIGQDAVDAPVAAARAAAEPLRPDSVYGSWPLWRLAAIYFGFGFSYIIYSTFFVRHLTVEAGFSRAAAGTLWFEVGVVSVASGFVWGSVSDRWGRRMALAWVFALQGIAFLLFGLSRAGWAVYASAGLFALTAWSVPALMAALCGDLFGARLASAALGLVTMVFGVGQALGPFVAGRIADTTQSFGRAFLLAGIVALALGFAGSIALPRYGREVGRRSP